MFYNQKCKPVFEFYGENGLIALPEAYVGWPVFCVSGFSWISINQHSNQIVKKSTVSYLQAARAHFFTQDVLKNINDWQVFDHPGSVW